MDDLENFKKNFLGKFVALLRIIALSCLRDYGLYIYLVRSLFIIITDLWIVVIRIIYIVTEIIQ